MSNVIDFQEARARRVYQRELAECNDTHDAVLDVSDVVFTADDINCNVEIEDDYIIIHTSKSDEDSTIKV